MLMQKFHAKKLRYCISVLVALVLTLALLIPLSMSMMPSASAQSTTHTANANNASPSSTNTNISTTARTTATTRTTTAAASLIPCGTIVPDSSSPQATNIQNEVKLYYNQATPNYDLPLNAFNYTIDFNFSTTQKRNHATVCFTIDGENAKYVEGFDVQMLEGNTVAWPEHATKQYDTATDTYYYSVTFPNSLAQGSTLAGNINIRFKTGYPSIWSEAPLHVYVADDTTNSQFVEQQSSPLKHRFIYGDYAASHFSKFVHANYFSSNGENTKPIQVIGGNGEAATNPHTGVHYIPADSARPVKYTFSGRSIYYADDQIIVTDTLPTYTDKDGKTRHAILQCPTAEDTSGISADGAATAAPNDCKNDQWVVDEQAGTATLTLESEPSTIFQQLQQTPLYLAFPDIALDKSFEDADTPGVKRYYTEINNHAEAKYRHAGNREIDHFKANENASEMDPVEAYLVPEATYGDPGNITELIRDIGNHHPTTDDKDYTSSTAMMDYRKNKTTDYPWYVGFYNNTSMTKHRVALKFKAAPGLKITKIDHLIEPVSWVGDAKHGWNIAWTFTQFVNQPKYSLQNHIQSITVCTDDDEKHCTTLEEDPSNWSYANVGYGQTFDPNIAVRSVTITLDPDFQVPAGKGIWFQPYTQFIDPDSSNYDESDPEHNNYVSTATAWSANMNTETQLSSNRIATLTLTAPDDGIVQIHSQNGGYTQGESNFASKTTDGQTLAPLKGDTAVFAVRMNNEKIGNDDYHTELNPDAPYNNLRLVFYAPHGVDLSKAKHMGFNGSDNMITRTEVVDNYKNSGKQAYIMYLDREQYEKNLQNSILMTAIGVRMPLDNDIFPGRHEGYFQVEWDEGKYDGKIQQAGTSKQQVEQGFYVDSTAVRTFDKGVVTKRDAAEAFDTTPTGSQVKAGQQFYYTLSENFFGQADMPTSVVIDALPRANTTVDPKTGNGTTGPDYDNAKLKRDLDVYMTGPVTGLVISQDPEKGYKTSAQPSTGNFVAWYTTDAAVQTQSMKAVRDDSSITWVSASAIHDWKQVTGIKISFTKLARNAITRVLVPVTTDHAPIDADPDSTEAKTPFISDNIAGHLFSDRTDISEHKATVQLMPTTLSEIIERNTPELPHTGASGLGAQEWMLVGLVVLLFGIGSAIPVLRNHYGISGK